VECLQHNILLNILHRITKTWQVSSLIKTCQFCKFTLTFYTKFRHYNCFFLSVSLHLCELGGSIIFSYSWLEKGHESHANNFRALSLSLSLSHELSPSRESASCAATQELSSISWTPKVHCRVHKSPFFRARNPKYCVEKLLFWCCCYSDMILLLGALCCLCGGYEPRFVWNKTVSLNKSE
jgi:hypothetical protein